MLPNIPNLTPGLNLCSLQHFLIRFYPGKTRIFLLRPRYRSAGRQAIFSGGGRRKNGPVFLVWHFKNSGLV